MRNWVPELREGKAGYRLDFVSAMGLEARPQAALLRLPSFASYHPQPPPSPTHLFVCGIGIIVAGVLLFSVFLYAAVVSKLLPPSGVHFLDAIRNDQCVYLSSSPTIWSIVRDLTLW